MVVAVVEVDHLVVPRAEPVRIKRYFALSRSVHHAAGHDKFSVSDFLAGENLIGGEDHIFETLDCIDEFDLTSVLLQNATERFPLAARFHSVHCGFSRPFGKLRACHVRVFLIDDIEIIRRTEQDLRHTIDGSWALRAQARKLRRGVGTYCRLGGKVRRKISIPASLAVRNPCSADGKGSGLRRALDSESSCSPGLFLAEREAVKTCSADVPIRNAVSPSLDFAKASCFWSRPTA